MMTVTAVKSILPTAYILIRRNRHPHQLLKRTIAFPPTSNSPTARSDRRVVRVGFMIDARCVPSPASSRNGHVWRTRNNDAAGEGAVRRERGTKGTRTSGQRNIKLI